MISCTGAMWVLSLSQAFINPETVLTPVIITGEPEPSRPGGSVCLSVSLAVFVQERIFLLRDFGL